MEFRVAFDAVWPGGGFSDKQQFFDDVVGGGYRHAVGGAVGFVGVGIGVDDGSEPLGATVLHGGFGDEVVHAALVFEDHERDDVATISEVVRGIEFAFERGPIGTVFGIELRVFFAGGDIAEVGDSFMGAGDIPTAPAFGEWAGVSGEVRALSEDGAAIGIGDNRADEHAGDAFCARAGMA